MPRTSKIAPAVRREWLDEYDHGKRIDNIAKQASRTERTVKDQIDIARKERDNQEVRAGLLRAAYRDHYGDLLGFAEDLRQSARKPDARGLLPDADLRARKLRDGLRSHVPKSGLWKAWEQWEHWSHRIEKFTDETRDSIEYLVGQKIRVNLPGVPIQGFADSLWIAVEESAKGIDISYREYHHEPRSDGGHLSWGAIKLADQLTGEDDVNRLTDQHRVMLERWVSTDEIGHVERLQVVWRNWNAALKIIEEEVEVFILRRLLPGQCGLCPSL